MRCLNFLPVSAWVLSLEPPPTVQRLIWLTGDSKMTVGVNMSMNSYLSLSVSHGTDCQPVQTVPMAAGVGSRPPVTLN